MQYQQMGICSSVLCVVKKQVCSFLIWVSLGKARVTLGQNRPELNSVEDYLYDAERQTLFYEGRNIASILCEKGRLQNAFTLLSEFSQLLCEVLKCFTAILYIYVL